MDATEHLHPGARRLPGAELAAQAGLGRLLSARQGVPRLRYLRPPRAAVGRPHGGQLRRPAHLPRGPRRGASRLRRRLAGLRPARRRLGARPTIRSIPTWTSPTIRWRSSTTTAASRLSFHANSHVALQERRWYLAGTRGTLIADLVRNRLMIARRSEPRPAGADRLRRPHRRRAQRRRPGHGARPARRSGRPRRLPGHAWDSLEAGLTVMAIDEARAGRGRRSRADLAAVRRGPRRGARVTLLEAPLARLARQPPGRPRRRRRRPAVRRRDAGDLALRALASRRSRTPLILRRAPGGDPGLRHRRRAGDRGRAASRPPARRACRRRRCATCSTPEDGLGHGFIMGFVEGETLGGRIVRRRGFARRPRLPGAPVRRGPGPHPHHRSRRRSRACAARRRPSWSTQYRATYRASNWPRPVFDLAFRWLDGPLPAAAGADDAWCTATFATAT